MSFPSRSNCSLRGVFTLSSICAASSTFPFSVASPTAVTRQMPWPSITFVPRSTWLEGKVASSSNSSATVVLRQRGSPVSVLSSTLRCVDSRSSASAGMSSPVPNITMSPTTMSDLGTSVVLPSRITRTGSSSFT